MAAENEANGIVPQIENGKRIYTVAQFTRFSPQTAADVVAQIPGFSITNVSNDRGLGEASQNVLINGQRITGKGNDANVVLRRIPVNTISRLEIVDGSHAGHQRSVRPCAECGHRREGHPGQLRLAAPHSARGFRSTGIRAR